MSETALWILLIIGQICSAGNMNYQQDKGYYEINPAFTKHPSKERIYYTKGASMLVLYSLTKAYPKYKKPLLIVANAEVYGFILYDSKKGISFTLRF